METQKRTLRILDQQQQRERCIVYVPKINLIGKWLDELGFKTGKDVQVVATHRKLVITVKPKKRKA